MPHRQSYHLNHERRPLDYEAAAAERQVTGEHRALETIRDTGEVKALAAEVGPQIAQDVIRKSEIKAWLRMGILLMSIVGAAFKLGTDASDLRHEMADMHSTIEKHSLAIASLSDLDTSPVGKKLAIIEAKLDDFIHGQNEAAAERRGIIDRLNDRDRERDRFWSTTWPSIEGRLIRVENFISEKRR